MESKVSIALSSPAFWSMAAIAVYAGLSAVLPELQGTPQIVVTAVLAVIAAVAHPSEVQKAGSTQK